jgi:hypothetical protein
VVDTLRKKSPRAPTIALDDALDRALRAYDKDRRHPSPVDVFAQHLGYKNGSNGAAASVLASLRYFGLVERPREGLLGVTKEVEEYKFVPSEEARHKQLIRWLRTPPIFADLLEKYQDGLPSDATLKFDLIQRGFSPISADACLVVFRRSVEYAKYFNQLTKSNEDTDVEDQLPENPPTTELDVNSRTIETSKAPHAPFTSEQSQLNSYADPTMDRIPVRLSQGRRAWLEIPMPFYEADKARLKAQIDMILTDDEE